MGKRKKSSNELDAILEQLKRSYGADVDSELEDSLLDDEKSEEDDEFSSVLAKIFSNMDEDKSDSVAQDSRGEADDVRLEEQAASDAVVESTEAEEASVLENAEKTQVDDEKTESQEKDVQSPSEVAEVNQQEDIDVVLDAMLHRSASLEESAKDTDADAADNARNVFSLVAAVEAFEDNCPEQPEQPEQSECIEDSIAPTTVIDGSTIVEDIPEADIPEIIPSPEAQLAVDALEDAIPEIAEEPEILTVSDDHVQVVDEDAQPIDSSLDSSLENEVQDEPEKVYVEPPVKVLDPLGYTADPLQLGLADLEMMRIEEYVEEIQVSTAKEEPIAARSESVALDSNDVSLLVKFGYGEEVNAQIGRDKAKKVIFDKESSYTPERHTVPCGFSGKEYSDRSQDESIRQKYKNDRFALFVSLMALSAFTLISFIFGLIFEFAPNKLDYYVAIMALDFILVAIAALICGRRILFGAIRIAKFESDHNSVLLALAAEYIVYNLLVSIIYAIEPILLYNSFCWISGSCILAYFAITTLCDLINCEKEYKTFELMTSRQSFYTAEKLSPSDELGENARTKGPVNAAPGTYRVRKTSMMGRYFKRISESSTTTMSPVYALGIVPSISLTLACCTAIISENVMIGIHTFTMTSMLCIPLSTICLATINGFITAKKYRADNSAFIGANNETEYSTVTTLVFDDTEAVEITAYKEINPGKNAGDTSDKLVMAYNVFKALRGPMGEAIPDKYKSEDSHELIINSISDNGINIYFDASTNILIGDKQYMLEHNLKVKTDVNLTTATKGADRYVVYMAFDGKPQLGFVLTQRTKPDFVKTVSILASSGIAMAIETYEPEVNDTYFEQNKTSDYSIITVHKPSRYQEKTDNAVCDGALIATDALSLAKAISKSKHEPARKLHVKSANFFSLIIGGALAILISLLMCFDSGIIAFSFLREHPYIALAVSIVLTSVPAIINAVKEHIRK